MKRKIRLPKPVAAIYRAVKELEARWVAGENPRAGCCVYRDNSRNKHRELDDHGRPFV